MVAIVGATGLIVRRCLDSEATGRRGKIEMAHHLCVRSHV